MTEEPSPRPRRWLVPALLLVGVLLLVAAGSLLTLARYAPLQVGSSTTVAGPAGEPSLIPYAGTRLAVVQYVDQATMSYTIPLENDGPVGVTVTGIDVREGPGRLLALDSYLVTDGTPQEVGTQSGSEPSFALGGGSEKFVTLFLRFVNCQTISPRTGTNLDVITVSYRGFGLVPRSQDVQLPDLIRTQSPSQHSRCPGVTKDSRPPG